MFILIGFVDAKPANFRLECILFRRVGRVIIRGWAQKELILVHIVNLVGLHVARCYFKKFVKTWQLHLLSQLRTGKVPQLWRRSEVWLGASSALKAEKSRAKVFGFIVALFLAVVELADHRVLAFISIVAVITW